MKKQLCAQVAPLLEAGVHFAEVWVEEGGGEELSPLFAEEEAFVESAVHKRKREFRAGRHVARRALVDAGGPGVALLRGPRGEPQFPAGYRGSITHTGRRQTYAAAVAARGDRLLGIDVEMQDELSPNLIARIAERGEVELASAVAREPGLLVFAAKEAVYKCVYPLCERVLEFEEVRLVHATESSLELRVHALGGAPSVFVRWLREAGVTLCLAYGPSIAATAGKSG